MSVERLAGAVDHVAGMHHAALRRELLAQQAQGVAQVVAGALVGRRAGRHAIQGGR